MTRPRLLALAAAALAAGGGVAGAVLASGGATRGDERREAGSARLPVRRAYAGVACRAPNRIACDRIGLAVWLPRGAFTSVKVRVGGRWIALARGRDGLWSGYLADAGLRDGPLRVPVRDGRWIGRDPPIVRASLDAARADGSHATAAVATPLRPGWG